MNKKLTYFWIILGFAQTNLITEGNAAGTREAGSSESGGGTNPTSPDAPPLTPEQAAERARLREEVAVRSRALEEALARRSALPASPPAVPARPPAAPPLTPEQAAERARLREEVAARSRALEDALARRSAAVGRSHDGINHGAAGDVSIPARAPRSADRSAHVPSSVAEARSSMAPSAPPPPPGIPPLTVASGGRAPRPAPAWDRGFSAEIAARAQARADRMAAGAPRLLVPRAHALEAAAGGAGAVPARPPAAPPLTLEQAAERARLREEMAARSQALQTMLARRYAAERSDDPKEEDDTSKN